MRGALFLKRRSLIAAGLTVASLPARAQQPPKALRVGTVSGQPRPSPLWDAFLQRMSQLGYQEGRNLSLDVVVARSASEYEAFYKRFSASSVDVVVAPGPDSSLKGALVTPDSIPIVMVAIDYDPLERGFVKSLARPGGRVTGVFLQQIEVGVKRLQLLKDAFPDMRGTTVFWDQLSVDQWKAIEAAGAKPFVETQYRARVIGKDPFDVEAIWEDLYNRVKDYGTTGMAISAISGIDIALWDIMGRAVNKPVHKLIGGAYRNEVIPYATGLYFIDMNRLVEEAVEEALEFKNDGFRAIKMKIGLGDLKLDAKRVGAVRKAIGPDVKLAVDANHCFSVPNAIKLGRMLEEHDILWFEEPISPEDHDGYVEVTRALDMAVAGGENDFTRWGFRDVISRKAMDIVQPDLCAAGGFSECRKIATLASAFGVECVPHAWGSAIGLAATVQFLAALPDQPPAFRPMPPMLEFEQTPNPLRDHLAKEPIEQKKGIVKVPGGPGLGIEIDREVLKKYKVA